jgi:hypothetical protein
MASPEGGRLVVELVLGRSPGEMNPFRLERFEPGALVRSQESMVIWLTR